MAATEIPYSLGVWTLWVCCTVVLMLASLPVLGFYYHKKFEMDSFWMAEKTKEIYSSINSAHERTLEVKESLIFRAGTRIPFLRDHLRDISAICAPIEVDNESENSLGNLPVLSTYILFKENERKFRLAIDHMNECSENIRSWNARVGSLPFFNRYGIRQLESNVTDLNINEDITSKEIIKFIAQNLDTSFLDLSGMEFTKLELLGRGGFADAYLKKLSTFELPVVVKVYRNYWAWAVQCPILWSRVVKHEIEKTIRLGGIRGIPKLLGISPANPVAIVISYEGDHTFYSWLQSEEEGHKVSTILRVLGDTIKIMINMHSKKISHNDFHWENIVINEKKEPAVIDFGHSSSFGVKRFKPFLLQMPFMHALRLKPVNGVVDVFAIGKILRNLQPFLLKDPKTKTKIEELSNQCMNLKVNSMDELLQKIEAISNSISSTPFD